MPLSRYLVKRGVASTILSLRALPIAVFLLVFPVATFAQPATAGTVQLTQHDHKRVLVLYSTRRDAQFSIVGERELTRILDVGLARNLDYYSEFIDLARFPDPVYQLAFRDYLRLKYPGLRFDLVIAMQDAAVTFVNGHRETLFPDAPVIFLSNSAGVKRAANSTGFVHERNLAETIAFIRQLQPDVRNVFVVSGAAAADRQYEATLREQVQPVATGLTITYFSGLPTRELENRLSRLPEHSAVYYLLATEDGAGDRFHPLHYVTRLAGAANAPTYCWVDSTMGLGILGGSLYRQSGAIERVGQLALRVLSGEPADSIPVANLDLNANEVDWRQLRRWRIGEDGLPPGTLVRFRDPTLWDRYRTYVLGALALLITQTVLITGLLIQRRRRQRAEAELRGSQRELRRSYERNRDLAARLLKAQETERSRIARELHDDICQRMLLLTIELESLGHTGSDAGQASDALVAARDVAKSLHEISHRLHPTRLRMIGLTAALDRLCVEASRAGIPITYTHENVPSTLPADVMLCLFRVVQEALQNAIKYSDARQILVHLQGGGGELTLMIEDDGVGFDADGDWGKGVGLLSMVERLEAVGGSLQISSTPGVGTRLTARLRQNGETPVNSALSTGRLEKSPI